MGYRSDVAYGVRVDEVNLGENATEEEKNLSADGIFLLMLTEMQQDEVAGKCFDSTYDINEHLTVNKENRTIAFYEDGVKWYESYADVKAHERLYEIAEEYAEQYGSETMNNPVSCAFIRIGEETDDVEERGGGYDPWNIMYVSRSIEMNI
jgi:hypothetical protein